MQAMQPDALNALAAQQAAMQVLQQAALQAQGLPQQPLQQPQVPQPGAAVPQTVQPPQQQPRQQEAGQHVGPPIPGVTDVRHTGVIISMLHEKGFAFIRCPELKERYPNNDLFLHKNQWQNFKVGDAVSFAVFLNKQQKPNAKELEPAEMSEKLAAIQPQGGPRQQQQQQQRPPMMGGMPAPPMPPGGMMPPPPAPGGGMSPMPQAGNEPDITLDVPFPIELLQQASAGFEAIKQQLGDVRLELGGQPDKDTRLIRIRGPSFSANLAATLILQHLAAVCAL